MQNKAGQVGQGVFAIAWDWNFPNPSEASYEMSILLTGKA